MILQDRHAPLLTGSLAKAAAGAIERYPHARVVNLSRALEQLSELGWRTVGLAGDGEQDTGRRARRTPGRPGAGLRRAKACAAWSASDSDTLAKIGLAGGMENLNVSAAAAVALLRGDQGSRREGETGNAT